MYITQYITFSIQPIPFNQSHSANTVQPIPLDQFRSTNPIQPIPFNQSRSTNPVQPIPFNQSRSTNPVQPIPFNQSHSTNPVQPIPFNQFLCKDLPPKTPVPCKPDLITRARIRPRDFQRWCYDSTPVVGTRAREQWAEFLNRCPERFQIDLPLEGCGQTNTVRFVHCIAVLKYPSISDQRVSKWTLKCPT